MQKTSLASLVVVVGLLVLCVTTLVAIYATGSGSPAILLFEENFDVLDGTKWEQQTADCREDGGRMHFYETVGAEGYTDEGILYIKGNLTEEQPRKRRAEPRTCYSCVNPQDSKDNCVPSLHSSKLQTKNAFRANSGRIEVRARIPGGSWIKSFIGIAEDRNETSEESEGGSEGFQVVQTAGGGPENGSAEVTVFLRSTTNQTVKSRISADDFHVYEMEWEEERISFKVDGRLLIPEDSETSGAGGEGEATDSTAGGTSRSKRATDGPFRLIVGVHVGEKLSENQVVNAEDKRLSDDSIEGEESGTALEVDYVRLFGSKP